MTDSAAIEERSLVGIRAPSLYRRILLSDPGTQSASICKYTAPPPLQQRIEMTRYEADILEVALAIRQSNNLPFWEALFSACLHDGECRDSLLDAALLHNGPGEAVECTRRDIEAGCLEKIANAEARNVGLSSAVIGGNGETRHLLFLDFHCAISEQNTCLVRRVCHRLIPGGFVILDSGDSYHATSVKLLTNEERIACLGKALLFAPIVDTTYIAHQLQQSASTIRISAGGKCQVFPTVVAVDV